jgi:hypothetical protein
MNLHLFRALGPNPSPGRGRADRSGGPAPPPLPQRFVTEWSGLVDFEIVPVVPGKDVAAALAAQL